MKRTVAGIAAVVTMVIAPGTAFAAQPSNPGCFGQFASTSAHTQGGNGQFVSGFATSPAYKGSGNLSIGRDGVPALKAVACGP